MLFMKKIWIPALFLFLAACKGQEEKTPEEKGLLSTDVVKNPANIEGTDTAQLATMATMDFTDTTHNFGSIREGEKVVYDFSFKNNGKTPLIIASAVGSCGCTVPAYPTQPIAPGESGVIKVEFNSADKAGHQEKSISVSSNTARGISMLYITADVQGKQ